MLHEGCAHSVNSISPMKKEHYLIFGILTTFVLFGIPTVHLLKTKLNETEVKTAAIEGYTNDESHLNRTKIDTIILVPETKTKIIEQLKQIIRYAKANQLKISIAGARHSMGGHTMYENGVVINMLPYKEMVLDTITNVLTIGSGALWEDAIQFLDKSGKSISIMQAFSSFSVGGSLSVNGHGWQKNLPPISASVVSFTLMNADGAILNCTRNQNTELFKSALGGYGLFGIILDVKLKVVENTALEYKHVNISTNEYLKFYDKFISANEKTELVFGRLRISKKNFLEEATLNYFEKKSMKPDQLPEKNSSSIESKRIVFRGSVASEYGKRLRWNLESGANKISNNTVYSRNELLNDDVSLIENKDSTSTDILHEYFIPERNFHQFINDIKPILLNSHIDLLNITIRRVESDMDTYLNYAKETVYGFVMLFNQKKTGQQENKMIKLTNDLVDASIKSEGTYYLPYRLHIGKDKMRLVYPQSDNFFNLKLKYDSLEVFSNKFYEHYK
jgi:FAD/FMN-containing dehydrogenase